MSARRLPPPWTPSQRGVVAGAVALLIMWLAVRLWLNPSHVSNPQPERPARYDELADRIDPNTADEATLGALPGVGPARARDIVNYRDSFRHPEPGRRPFERPEDLLKVKGIGVSMMETLRPYLIFRPTTQPGTASS